MRIPALRVVFMMLSGASVMGCAGSVPKVDLAVAVQADDVFYGEDALRKTVTAFVGDAAVGGIVGAIPSDLFTDSGGRSGTNGGSGTPFARDYGRKLALQLRTEQAVGRRFTVEGSMQLALGQTRYTLPQGAGVLVEPIKVRFTHLSADTKAGVVYHVPAQYGAVRVKTRLSVGAGTQTALVRTELNSPILDVSHTSVTTQPYVYGGVGVEWRRVRLQTEVRRYRDFGLTLNTGLSHRF